MEKERIHDFRCPICNKPFKKSKKGRTAKQWEFVLIEHLLVFTAHRGKFKPEEAKSIAEKHLKSSSYTIQI